LGKGPLVAATVAKSPTASVPHCPCGADVNSGSRFRPRRWWRRRLQVARHGYRLAAHPFSQRSRRLELLSSLRSSVSPTWGWRPPSKVSVGSPRSSVPPTRGWP